MVRKKDLNEKDTGARRLTDLELFVMNVIWDRIPHGGECTVREIVEGLPSGRGLAYTTIATVMKILEQKGVLLSHKAERTHTYSVLTARSEYEVTSLQQVTEEVFRGDTGLVVKRLLDDGDLSRAELSEIRKLLDERMRGK
ncbi:MAG: BlaI/MecI/CopY family transcriptional regulator [Bdellovibrionota bacterium]